jgi:L-2-hydroxycarboxylate dehydrogenase (NAD+)
MNSYLKESGDNMRISIDEARSKLSDIYKLVIDDESLINWLVEITIDNDLTGNRFSGFNEAIKFVKEGKRSFEQYSLAVDKAALKLIDCHDTPAYVVMKDVLPRACEWAKTQGMVFIGFQNGGYHEALGTIARKFAEQDLLCIYSSNGGPQGVVPFGGSKDIMGTNPLAYAIPTSELPILFDAATAEFAYGTIGIAKERGETLPENTYLNKDGRYTTDPNDAIALIPFGGYKGYAINVLLEVMTAALVGGKSGLLQMDESGLGGFLMLIDPSSLGSLEAFKKQTDKLVTDIEAVTPAEGFTEVRVPGHKSQALRQEQLVQGFLEVDDATYDKFLKEYNALTADSDGK